MKKSYKHQEKMPYVASVVRYVKRNRTPFHMPGHKQGKGINTTLLKLWDDKIFRYDLTEVDGLDYLNAPSGIIAKAERLAAEAFHVEKTFFLINGSTVGNQAAILSLVKNQEKILIPRNSHQSVFSSLILSGAHPIYITPTYHEAINSYPAVSKKNIQLALTNNADTKAIHLTSPNYNGFVSDIASISKIAQKVNIPLIVDEAHGAHFQFHPDLPASAIEEGADIVVQSTHKTLGALTQASMLHLVKSNHVSADQLQEILMLLQSSSPNSLLIMSLDAARQQIAIQGHDLLKKVLQLSRYARSSINRIRHYHCYGKELVGQSDIVDIDETKLFIQVSETGFSGYEIEKILGKKYDIEIEMSDPENILCFVTIGDTEQSINKLLTALKDISKTPNNIKNKIQRMRMPAIPELVILPREAFFSQKISISLSQAFGEICGEFIIPFPPDVPIIAPGERINKEILEYVKYIKNSGTMIVGPKDISLDTIVVIKYGNKYR